ncbi:hypothetical protein E0H32_05935 [Rhizobium leguminosarum bv. viciae]|nr:hypothetical protein E0H32_05935 [Rhizobium leguminosarum bv. viciae]
MTTSSLVETMIGRSRHVLYDHHVAERVASPRSRSLTAAGTLRGARAPFAFISGGFQIAAGNLHRKGEAKTDHPLLWARNIRRTRMQPHDGIDDR